ncbi:cytochrome-450 hydroxylase [Cantharellus anzutake]|uniref:cytochrome-450 hydroxylase n=1 Tax=Cantharellus anzutake TaxID=1750568 RepID=UPI0019081FAF|nr:cytochrome-450 hydroxylase [Cantharellus anzutake]KAF8319579.1 cytochrome-450 hydroxylase [Cantharellus anzutake]
MGPVFQSVVVLLASALAWLLYEYVVKAIRSPLRRLPGPISRGIFANHLTFAMDPIWSAAAQDQWSKRFGLNLRIKGFNWFDNRLLTLDPRAVHYILHNPQLYEKPTISRRYLAHLIGEGLLATEGPQHRQQRKVMNPAFSPSNLRALTPVFFTKAFQLRDKWLSLMEVPRDGSILNVSRWISRATFDVIGVAGFGYEFNAIEEENEAVYLAYKVMFDETVNQGQSMFNLASMYFPFIRRVFRTREVRINEASQATIAEAGKTLVEKKKREFQEGNKESRDLLSLLVRSNLAPETDPSQRITDVSIANQINTFLFAGSDTTSLAISWCILLLAQHQDIQQRLRNELVDEEGGMSADNEFATADFFVQLDKLPYLDNVCKEILRSIPPVHSSIRMALKDDIIPISSPMRWEDRKGKTIKVEAHPSGIKIAKGEYIHIPFEGLNLAKHVWGEDAHEFKPDRWDHLPDAARSAPGLYSNIMTFGYGPRSCIGMRFSLMEMKTFLFVLLRSFRFDDPPRVRKVNVIVTRPYVKGSLKEGTQMPIRVTSIGVHGKDPSLT